MATPTFPISLPAPLISQYGYKDDIGNVSLSPKSFGYQTQKQISNTPYTNFTIGFIFTQSQMNTFEDFYKTDLINGHKWFIMTFRVGVGYLTHHCRMPDKYSANLISNQVWQVGFNLKVDIKRLISNQNYIDLIEYDSTEDFYDSTDILLAYANGYSSSFTKKTILTSFGEDNWP